MKKKVLIFSTSYIPDVAGAEVAVEEITNRVKGYEWHLVCFPDTKGLQKEEKIGNVFVYRVSGPKFLYPLTAFLKGVSLNKVNNFDFVWSIMATYAGFAGLFFKLFFPQKKFLLSLQEGDELSLMKRKAWFVYPIFMMIFRFADKIQALSEFLAVYGREMGHKNSISIISNGVDLKKFQKKISQKEKNVLLQTLDKKDDDFYIITVSRLVYKNAIDDVIRALTYLPNNVKFLILGIGKERQNLKKLAVDLGVRDRVNFIGFVKHDDLPLFFSVSDIFIRPSRSEGFGNSFIEAMAFGLPTVATPVGGIPDFISDNQTGVFVAPNNPRDISEKLKMLISDKEFMQRIALNGRNLVTDKYSWDIIADKMKEEVFNNL